MSKRKTVLLLTAVALLLTIAVGGTIAYLTTSTETVENVFEPASVVPEIEETFTGTEKDDVYFWNSGEVDAYIRAAVVVNWKNQTTGELQPIKESDYTMTIPAGRGWSKANDGFYYYGGVIKPSESKPESAGTDYSTTVLLTDCKLASGVTPPDGYTLHVEIIAQAIQADGMNADSAQEAFAKAAQ